MQTAAVIARVSTHTRAHFHGITTQFCPVVCHRDGRREVKTEVFREVVVVLRGKPQEIAA